MLNIPTFQHVALLIDADNAQLSHLQQILKIANYYGNLKIRCAYGDWQKPPLSSHYENLCALDITCIQVDRIGKDTTDKLLMIEAGEILGAGDADLFIIVSSDGDFRQLCERIKQKGRNVIGIGNKARSSTHLQKSCDAFYYVEELDEALIHPEQTRLQKEFEALLFQALEFMPCDKAGWVLCATLGSKLRELDQDFAKRFGKKKLSVWLRDLGGQFEIKGQKVRALVIEPAPARKG